MKDLIELSGDFNLVVFKNGLAIKKYSDKNLIVRLGRDLLARLIGGDVNNKFISRIAIGINDSIPVPSNTAITGGIIKNLSRKTYSGAVPMVSCEWILEAGEMNGLQITEFGLLCNDNSLFARKTNEPIVKDSTIHLEGVWNINF